MCDSDHEQEGPHTPPLVTVVVPTYNRAHVVGAAIASALAQTFRNFRLVVSDNCSTDTTSAVVATFTDRRIHYIRRQHHVGLNEHFNQCISEVETKYLFILPDDDVLLPEALATLVPVLERHPHAGIAHGRAHLIDGEGNTIAASHDMTGLSSDKLESGEQFIENAMQTSHRIHGSTVLFRTEAAKSVVLDLRDFPGTEFGYWLRLALGWDIAFLARTVSVYRIHAATYTSRNALATRGGYLQGLETIQNIYQVKSRFLRENAHRLRSPTSLRRAARRALASQLVDFAGHATLPERRVGRTLMVLGECARRAPGLSLQLGAWRLLAASLLGPRLVERYKQQRRVMRGEA